MRKLWKYVYQITIIATLFLVAIPVQAAGTNVNVPTGQVVTLYNSKDRDIYGYKPNDQRIGYVDGKAITNLKSSNPAVFSVKKSADKMPNGRTWTTVYGTVKKAGKTTVSFKVNGKTYKANITVKKYVNPISSIKVGSTTISKAKYASSSSYTLKYSKFANKKSKILIKLKSGWDFSDKPLGKSGTFWYGPKNKLQLATFGKSGKTITFKGGKGFAITFNVKEKSTGQLETINILFK